VVEFINFQFAEMTFAVYDGELRFTDCEFSSQGSLGQALVTKSALIVAGDRSKLTLTRVRMTGFRTFITGNPPGPAANGAAIRADPSISAAYPLRPTGVVATVRARLPVHVRNCVCVVRSGQKAEVQAATHSEPAAHSELVARDMYTRVRTCGCGCTCTCVCARACVRAGRGAARFLPPRGGNAGTPTLDSPNVIMYMPPP
jgi:hypothetical protein